MPFALGSTERRPGVRSTAASYPATVSFSQGLLEWTGDVFYALLMSMVAVIEGLENRRTGVRDLGFGHLLTSHLYSFCDYGN